MEKRQNESRWSRTGRGERESAKGNVRKAPVTALGGARTGSFRTSELVPAMPWPEMGTESQVMSV